MCEKFILRNRDDYEMYTTTSDGGKTFGKVFVDFKPEVIIHLNDEDVVFKGCKKITSDEGGSTLYFHDGNDNVIVESRMSIPVFYNLEGETYQKGLDLEDFKYKETIKTFLEGEFGELGLSESELMSFCSFYSFTLYTGYDELADRVQTLQDIDYFIMDFVDVERLADWLGFTQINDNLWFEDYAFTEFEDILADDFDGDIFKAIKEWEVHYRGY